jgi:hypothetical protein
MRTRGPRERSPNAVRRRAIDQSSILAFAWASMQEHESVRPEVSKGERPLILSLSKDRPEVSKG